MSLLTSVGLSNQCTFRHSSRILPLKLSMNALSIGRSGAMKSSSIPRLQVHWSNTLLVNSVPLSEVSLPPCVHSQEPTLDPGSDVRNEMLSQKEL